MGNTDSVPIVSQIKSLVQVASGDAEAAKETQENFIRLAPVVSQVNSLVAYAGGDSEEALKIQEEAGATYLTLVENTPLIGHAIAAGHAIAGDAEMAEQVAIGATKSTLVVGAAVACGVATVGAAAAGCGAAAATATSFAWDGVESAVSGKTTGAIRGIENIATGKASVGDAFDTVAGVVLEAVGGALGARGIAGGKAKAAPKLKSPSRVNLLDDALCRRRRAAQDPIFDTDLPPLYQKYSGRLPGSIKDLQVASRRPLDLQAAIGDVFAVFLVLKLMRLGHPSSRPYYEELCGEGTFHATVSHCRRTLFEALQKYEFEGAPDLLATKAANFIAPSDGGEDTVKVKKVGDVLLDSIDALMFELGHMVKRTAVGKGLGLNFCAAFAVEEFEDCLARIDKMEDELRSVFESMDAGKFKSRARRSACGPKRWKTGGVGKKQTGLGKITKMASAFKKKHFADPGEFAVLQRIVKSGSYFRTAKELGKGGVNTILNPEQIRMYLKNPDKLIWGDVGAWGQKLSIKGVDFIDASRPKASGGVKRLTSGTGTVELTVKRVLDEATGEVRVVPVHLIGVANKKIKSTAFEI